jgi:dTDP-4-dehydrorhamnose 3,5-epimerase
MLDGMIKTGLKIITADKGSVMHGMKNIDNGFIDFGEIYFSTVEWGVIKAWKLHQQMTLNLIVPVGKVLFCFLDVRKGSNTYNKIDKILMSQDPYFRLTVPPGIWFGFKGVGDGLNLICNVADMVYSSREMLRKEENEIDIEWSSE